MTTATDKSGRAPRAGAPQAGAYPSAHDVDVALKDGSSLHVRPVRGTDTDAIRSFLEGLSPESIGFRFFGSPNLDWVCDWSVDVDYADRYALVAVTGQAGSHNEIVAHGAYMRLDERRAEVAFMVADAWQGLGIATIMLAHLAAAASEHGISTFFAEVLPHNHRMIDVFVQSGFPVTRHAMSDAIEIELPTSISLQTAEHFEQRERVAAVAALRGFLVPRSVAVIGASRRRRTIGGELWRNLAQGGFTGAAYAVNEKARRVQGERSYPSIAKVPGPVDMAVIATPAERVAGAARECAQARVRSLLVISGGFGEAGRAGERRQRELLGICRETGMRLIGPNCLGLLNTSAQVSLNATFAAGRPRPGCVGFLSQSGGLGIAIIQGAERFGIGLSSFVSVGDKADISGNDLLQYWEQDPETRVILLYLESFGNPRRFARIARRVSSGKPIVAVKSGRSPAGARAGASHTGALVATSDVTVDALFAQAGVIRTDTVHEQFDVAALLADQPVPRGGRVAIVTNAGGPGILCADACQAGGLEVVELPAKLRRQLSGFLDRHASVGNPVDMIAGAGAGDYRRTIELLASAGVCDAILAIFVPPLVTEAADVARAIHAAAGHAGEVTIAAVFMTGEPPPAELASPTGQASRTKPASPTGEAPPAYEPPAHEPPAGAPPRPAPTSGKHRVPSFDFPEDAARALAHAARYGRWRERPTGRLVHPAGTRPAAAAAIIARALAAGGGWLAPRHLSALLDCYGLPLVRGRTARTPGEAAAAAAAIGGPVALKAIAPGLLHKSDAGGVLLGLEGEDAVRAGARSLGRAVKRAGHRLEGMLVQPMASAEVELLMGVVHDESFGPVIACGAGGTRAELLGDVAVRITPLRDLDAAEMLRSLRAWPLLEGYRGSPPCDVPALEDVLLRLSALVQAHPQVAELDANPVAAGPDGAMILDARVRVAPAAARRPEPSLRA
jgi:acyl-CoA synthetase (NDP forming)/GNAT superfamily N-acetyltransferase